MSTPGVDTRSPLLELSINGAKGVLFNVTGGADLGMFEIDEAAKVITEAVDPDANIIFGAVIDPSLSNELKITVIATGFEGPKTTSVGSIDTAKTIFEEDPGFEEELDDELEIPAFIRKRME